MSFYSWIFGAEEEHSSFSENQKKTDDTVVVHTIEQMVVFHGEKKLELEQAEATVLKLKADLESLRITISNRLESEKNRIAHTDSSESGIVLPHLLTDSLTPKKTAQPMFY
jgi:hypothetical protein